MNRDDVLQHYRDSGALLEGHFLLTSGLHSPVYMQSAKVLMHPQRAEALCKALAAKITAALGPNPVDIVCSPDAHPRSEEHTSDLQSLMRISYADLFLKK